MFCNHSKLGKLKNTSNSFKSFIRCNILQETLRLRQNQQVEQNKMPTDESSKEIALAILKELQAMGFAKSSKALEKEIKKQYSLESLPSTLSEKVLVLQKSSESNAGANDDSSSTSDSSSGSSSSSSSVDDGSKGDKEQKKESSSSGR